MEKLERDLRNGKVIILSNENFQNSILNDDIREASLRYDDGEGHSWTKGFNIQFNGVLLHSSKTFIPMEKRLNTLINKWNLEVII